MKREYGMCSLVLKRGGGCRGVLKEYTRKEVFEECPRLDALCRARGGLLIKFVPTCYIPHGGFLQKHG